MTIYSIDEVFQFAIQIEKSGYSYYKKMTERFKDLPEIAKLFDFLAEEEVAHDDTFSALLSKLKTYDYAENYLEEYITYIRAFAENSIFSDDKLAAEMEEVDNPDSAITFAMRREQESINFYHELKNLVPPEEHERLDIIIGEEKKHYMMLYSMKADLAKTQTV
jgi:rubrerythrin